MKFDELVQKLTEAFFNNNWGEMHPHGSPYDRGSADAYYGRSPDPHWYPDGTGRGEKIKLEKGDKLYDLYMQGYNEETGRKDYGYDPE